MPIETWKTRRDPPKEDDPRALQQSHGENRALQYTLGGELQQAGLQNQHGEGHAPAARYNGYAEYVEPQPKRAADRAKHCKANDDTCMGWATSTGFCRPHSVQVDE